MTQRAIDQQRAARELVESTFRRKLRDAADHRIGAKFDDELGSLRVG
jgi:hypothetical protein